MLPTAFKTRKTSGYPNAIQVKDAYAQYTPSFPSSYSVSGSGSGSNTIPIATPEEIQARRARLFFSTPGRGVGRGTSKYHGRLYKEVGGFKVPIPPPPTIEGRERDENQESADLLRMMMEDDGVMDMDTDDVFDGPNDGVITENDGGGDDDSSAIDAMTVNLLSTPIIENQVKLNSPLLSEAFRIEYHRSHNYNSRFGALVNASIEAQPWPALPDIAGIYKHGKRSRATPLLLPGIDSKRQRNRYGRGLAAGQESGVGVIGSHSASDDIDTQDGCLLKVMDGPNGCDTPLYRFGEVPESFDAELPPLAVEHPARIWNSLIHGLAPENQPFVKWTYDEVSTEAIGPGWIANLTLGLPPTDSAHIDNTPPGGLRAKEFLATIESVSGVRRWAGEPRKLKADAMNVTLAQAMKDGAISWIRPRKDGKEKQQQMTVE